MATNRRRANGRYLRLDVSTVNGSGTANAMKSGDPGAVGQIPFVCLTDEDSSGFASVDTAGVYALSVVGTNDAGNSAVAVGDILYWDNAEEQINKEATGGILFGYALGTVGAGATATINVRLQPGA